MAVTIAYDDAEVVDALNRLLRDVQDLEPAMRDIAAALESGIEDAFQNQRSPAGVPWGDLSEHTKRRRTKAGKWPGQILQVSGDLAGSITSAYDRTSAVAGTNLVYAPTHQFGAKKGSFGSSRAGGYRDRGTDLVVPYSLVTPRPLPWGDIPARPFLGVSDDTRDEIVDAINRHLTDALEG